MTVAIPPLYTALDRLKNPTVSPADYAALAEVSTELVYRALHDGAIPAIRLGQRFRIPSAWVRHQLQIEG
jgi:excisionase family DNA binding protein